MDPVLKTRLVGAAVVILLAVIFVPMILKPSAQGIQQESELSLPDREVYELPAREQSDIQPLGQFAEDTASDNADDRSRLSSLSNQFPDPNASPEPVEIPSSAVIEQPEIAPVERPKPVIVKPDPVVTNNTTPETNAPIGDFAVQVGSFGDRNRAVVLKDKLQSAGYPAFIESSRKNGADMHRVKTGPVASREEGQSLLKLMQQDGLVKQGIIVSQAQ